jgi:type I restriction enzyme S subunit
VPPLPEQRTIAGPLSDVDALLGSLDRLIAKKRDLKQAAMQQLLTGQTRLPGFHGDWELKRLGDVADLNRLSVVPASQPNQPFVHFSLPAFDDGKSAQVELGATIGSNKCRVPSNAVLVSKLNPRIPRIWAPKYVPESACASTEWLVLTPREKTEREFLFVLCSSPGFCQQMELAATGTTGSHQRISPNTALDIRVAVPVDQKEQRAIADVLSDIDAELVALEARRDKTRALKQAMMQELLTGKTRLVSAGNAHA